MVDRYGYKRLVLAGAAVQAAFAILRIADGSFATLLVAQIGVACAQPFIVNGITKLVADWFETAHGAIANGVGTIGMFLGMAIAMAATPVLVESYGMKPAMIVFATIAVIAAVAFALGARERQPIAAEAPGPLFRGLFGRDLVLLYAISFLGLGFFNGLTTWLEPIVAPNGIGSVDAGVLGGVLIVAGIVGAGVVPALSDRIGRRKPFVVVCAVAALLTVYPLCTSREYRLVLALGGALGFFFLPAYALLLEMCAELAGASAAGRATGILMLMGNAGGVVVSVAMPLVKGDAPTYLAAVWLLMGTVAVAIVLALVVRETFSRHRPHSSDEHRPA
jgi:nitrate/nitrite transporter NarK